MRLLAALALCFSLSACQDALAAEASEIWTKKCQGCHGADGKAQTKMGEKHKIPDITTADFQSKHTDEQLLSAITDGVTDTKMPAWKEKLEAAEIQAMVKWVRAFGKK